MNRSSQQWLSILLLGILAFSVTPATLWHHHDHHPLTVLPDHGDDHASVVEQGTAQCLLCDSYMASYTPEQNTPMVFVSCIIAPIYLPDFQLLTPAPVPAGSPRAPPIG